MNETIKNTPPGTLGRRAFLRRGLEGLAAAGLAGALGLAAPRAWADPLDQDPAGGQFIFSRFRFVTTSQVQTEWDGIPNGDENLIATLRGATNVRTSDLDFNARAIGIDEFDKIRKNPFLFMTGEGDFKMSPEEAATLGEYFKRGGFLYADDCVLLQRGDHFYQAFLREIKQVMPGHAMQPVPPDHEIYRCFYEFPGAAPYAQGQHHPDMGLFYKNRMVCFLTSGDVHCGWSFPREFGQQKHQECLKMGVNIIIYALTH